MVSLTIRTYEIKLFEIAITITENQVQEFKNKMAVKKLLHKAIKSFGSNTLDRFRLVSSINTNGYKSNKKFKGLL